MSDRHAEASICVFWDTFDCKIPVNLSVNAVSVNIGYALRNSGHSGDVFFKAYGNKDCFIKPATKPNVKLIDIQGNASQRLRKISIDMYSSALMHPDSVLMFVMGDVSRDVDFIEELCAMRARGFGVFVCQPSDTSGLLYIPATKVWRWNSLVFGGTPIPDSKRFELSRVKNPVNYYSRRPRGLIDEPDGDDEADKGTKPNEVLSGERSTVGDNAKGAKSKEVLYEVQSSGSESKKVVSAEENK